MRKAILIVAYNRSKILLSNLQNLKKCKNYYTFKKVLVLQDGKKEIINKIKKIDKKIIIIKTAYTSDYSIYSKVNNNIISGFNFCFNKLSSNYVVFLEDDMVAGYDFLHFCDYIIKKYQNVKNFFAFNGFSKEHCGNNKFSYSKFIFGIGKGWAIPRRNFLIIKDHFNKILNPDCKRFFDVHLEFFIKKKFFVIMPYRSRTLESPSNGITFKKKFRYTQFYKDWQKSFVGTDYFPTKKYNYVKNFDYFWSKYCLRFSKINKFKSIYFYIIRKIYFLSKKLITT
jgi:hypothetical protein